MVGQVRNILDRFIQDPASYLTEGTNQDEQIRRISQVLDGQIALKPLDRGFLNKIKALPPDQRKGVANLSSKMFFKSFGLEGVRADATETLLLFTEEDLKNTATIRNYYNLFGKCPAHRLQEQIHKSIETIPQKDRASLLALTAPYFTGVNIYLLALDFSALTSMPKEEMQECLSLLKSCMEGHLDQEQYDPGPYLILGVILKLPKEKRRSIVEAVAPYLSQMTDPQIRAKCIETTGTIPEEERQPILKSIFGDIRNTNELNDAVFSFIEFRSLPKEVTDQISTIHNREVLKLTIELGYLRDRDVAFFRFLYSYLKSVFDEEEANQLFPILLRVYYEQRQGLLPSVDPYLEGITDGKYTALLESIVSLPQEERETLQQLADTYFKNIKSGQTRAEFLSYIVDLRREKRNRLFNLAAPYIQDIAIGPESFSILKAIGTIPEENREEVLRLALPFVKNTSFEQCRTLFETIHSVPKEKREEILSLIPPEVRNLPSPTLRVDFLSEFLQLSPHAINTIPVNERFELIALSTPLLKNCLNTFMRHQVIWRLLEIPLSEERTQTVMTVAELLKLKERVDLHDPILILKLVQEIPIDGKDSLLESLSEKRKSVPKELWPDVMLVTLWNHVKTERRVPLSPDLTELAHFVSEIKQEYIINAIFKYKTARRYFLKNQSDLVSEALKRKLSEDIDEEAKHDFLPLLSKEMVQKIVQETPEETTQAQLQARMEMDGKIGPVDQMLLYGIQERMIKGFAADDHIIEELRNFLDQIPHYSLALAAANPAVQPSILAYLEIMTNEQLAVVLPQISPAVFADRLYRSPYPRQILRMASDAQKKAYYEALKARARDVPLC